MIVYNKTWLANLRVQKRCNKEHEAGNITREENTAIKQHYPVGFYMPGWLGRIGLFILTCIVVLLADGLISITAASLSGSLFESGAWFFVLGTITYIGLELFLKGSPHYQSGVDDALLFVAGVQLTTGFSFFLHHADHANLWLSIVVLLMTLFFTLRFTDLLMTAVCCGAFFACVFFGWTEISSFGLATVPFVMMLAAGAVYWLAYINESKEKWIAYKPNLILVQAISLATLYAAGNYFIIQTLSTELMGTKGLVAFGAIFWIWTMALPFLYLYAGIRKKDAVLLRLGLILIGAAVATFRYYYHLLPTDVALTIGGAVILIAVYCVVKYLKTPRHGFTYQEPEEKNALDKLRIESLIVAQTFSHVPQAPANDGAKFGGGDFGGGGSSGSF